MSDQKLSGKVAIVTGSSAGIGSAIAIELARQGADVTIHGRDESKLQEVATQCQQLSPENKMPCIITGDITNEEVREKLISHTVTHFGKLDILVNNAGFMKVSPLEDTSLDSLDSMMDCLVRAPFHLTKLAIPQLVLNMGAVINISSVVSFRPNATNICIEYCMAKAALDQFTQWMARELGSNGVRVNSIHPGLIDTDIFLKLGLSEQEMNAAKEMYANVHALNRCGKPQEIAKAVAFLASSDASFMTGVLMPVDGGFNVMPSGPLKAMP